MSTVRPGSCISGALTDTAAALLEVGEILNPRWNESVSIRHLNLRQALGVDDIGLLDDVILIEDQRRQSINLVRCEGSFLAARHGPPDIIPNRSCKRPVIPNRLYRAH